MCKVNMSQTDACEECANKCRLIHKKKRDPSSIVSSCVKVMISDEFFDFLPLPPKFARTVASLMDQEKQVEDSRGRRCTLTLSTVNGRLGFGKGWRSFSSDHGIIIGDILIIHWILGSHFVVQIYGRSGCEKLFLPSRNITLPKKRSRAKPNSASRENGSAFDKNKELSEEEPCLMMVNRDTPTTGEQERITLYGDVFSSETSKTKPVGELDCVQNEIGWSNADATDNHIACENAVKNKVDDEMDNDIESGTMLMSTSYHSKTMHSESAKDVEIPEQLHNGIAQGEEDMLLDIDATFEGILENPLDVKLGDIIEDGCWKSEIDQKSNIVKKKENGVSTMNCVELQSARVKENSVPLPVKTDVHFSTPNIIKRNIHEMHTPSQSKAQITTSDRQIDGNKGKSILKEPASAVGGSQSTSIRYTPHKGTPGLSAKVIKTEPKEFNLAQFDPNKTIASEDLKLVKDEPVDHVSLEGVQATYLVTPNSESFFETRKRLPMPSRSEVNGKVVVLRDSSGRRWPVLYHNRYGLKGFGSGWGSFFKANGIRCGDECAFTLEDQSEPLYGVQVTKNNPVCGDA